MRRAGPLVALAVACAVAAVAAPSFPVGSLGSVDPAAAAGNPPHDQPVTAANRSFPDPYVIKVGATFYAYGTDGDLGNVQVMKSTDLATWTDVGDAMSGGTYPSFAQQDDVWAPAVLITNGDYVLYSSFVQSASATKKRCLGVTHSTNPAGGFKAAQDTCFVSDDAQGGVIDPSVFTTTNGTHHLLWKTEGVPGSTPPAIWSQQLAADGLSLVGAATRILISDKPWEGTLVENPFMVEDQGRLYLLYSGNEWKSDRYAVGWALCASPAGPCIKPPNRTLLHTEAPNLYGPGGGSVFKDETGQAWLAFAAWITSNTTESGGHRGLFLRRLKLIDNHPYLQKADGTYATSELTARVAGVNRYDTASLFSASTVQPQRPITYVASGSTFTDALIAAPASGSEASPVLLVQQGSIPQSVRDELSRLQPGHIVVMGGTDAISDAVYNDLAQYSNGSIHREAGIDQYHRSALVSRNTYKNPPVPIAYVATGEVFPDGLAGGAAGAFNRGPLLFVHHDGTTVDVRTELGRLQPARIVVLGGSAAVSDATLASLAQYSPRVDRVAGNDRYETAARLATSQFASVSGSVAAVVIATGENYPDAIAAGAAGYPVLLVPSNGTAPQVVKDALSALKPLGIVVMGGTAAVSQATLASLGL
ncbi:MAG: hypothetical protein QOI47_1651 [Actinomycetota bacterium]|nr:hypothetical protein [Actinomycetota bacterium]